MEYEDPLKYTVGKKNTKERRKDRVEKDEG